MNAPPTVPTQDAARTFDLASWPIVEFATFGPVEAKPMSYTQKIVATFLSRNGVMIPHVTHHDEADVSELDSLRKRLSGKRPGDSRPKAVLTDKLARC